MQIDPILRKDIADVVSLMRAFAEFEDLSQYCEITEERLASAMFGEDAFVEGLIARDKGTAAAYAIFYPAFSSFRGQRGLYLEDIYVAEPHRRTGLGRRMLSEIARIATERSCERIDFMVLDWNTPAIGFYLGLGAVRHDDERHFKFVDQAFRDLVL